MPPPRADRIQLNSRRTMTILVLLLRCSDAVQTVIEELFFMTN